MARTLRKVLWMVARSASVLLLALAVHAPADDIAPLDDPAADDALVAPGDDPTIDEIVDEIAAQAARFIDQWREASFARREQAGAELAELGLAARGPLLAALRDSDPEVRLRARRCLAKIVEDDFEARLAAFAADAHGTGRHDLPGWERFRVIAGGDEPPRKLFIEMLRAEGTLLETAEHAGPELVAETLALRCQQLQQLQSAADPAVRRGPSLASVAALLFVCGTPRLKAPDNVSGLIYNYVMQAPFQQALRGEYGVPLNKLVADWMVQPSSMSLAYQKVNLGIRFHVRECLHPAGQLVADRQTSPYMRMYGLLALAKYGGREHVGWLLTALDDKALCSQRVRAANGQQQQVFRGEVRDFALLALVRITGQRPADYGLGGVLDNPYSVYNTTSVGFASDEERTAALEKWKKWIADNPTPPSAPAPPALLPTNNAVRVARQAAPLADPTGAEDDAPVFVADREMRVRLTRALLMLETGRIGEACQLLDELLSADGGSAFRPERDHPIDRSVAAEALAIIATLAPEARQAYELHVGTEARKQLDEAVAKGDARRMAQVARRYFHSAAGQEAALLWSDWLLDAGQPHAAAVVLKRLRQAPDAVRFEPTLSQQRAVCLLRAGLAEEADAALAILNPDARDEAIRAAGASEVGLRRNDNQWLLFRADARRSGRAQAAAPWLRTAWRVDAAELPATREAMFRLVDAYRRQHLAVLPAASPIAADGKIIARTTGELLAIDSATGKLVWSVPLSNSVDELITDRGLQAAGAPQLLRGLDDRLFLDQTHGTLSSDGKSVFGVEDVGFAYGLLNQRNSVGPDGSRRLDPGWPQSFNRLTSYDVATGKLQWEIGGPQAELALPLAGTFFLGPPLPLGDRLFAVAERSGHIELMTLEKATGDLLAEQALAPLDASLDVISGAALQLLDQRPSRRLCGASPSYSDGILVCPTSPDNFVAVDLTTGRIVWAYLPLEPDEAPRGRVGVLAALAAAPALPEPASRDARWADCSVTIADGRALLTPASADRLYCLELTTGKRLWTALRLDGQYVAGALRGIVLVVGRGKVFGLSLETGKLAWEPTPLPPGSAPSGRGLFSGGRFLLPLSTAEIAIVDVASGKIVQRSRRTEGEAPGNLVACDRRVISQTAYGIEAFSLLDEALAASAAGLAERPDDPARLAEHGELLLSAARYGEAIAALRKAHDLRPSESAKERLAAAVLQALDHDFAVHRAAAADIEPLIASPQKAAFYRAMAEGLARSGEIAAAADVLLKLAELPSDEAVLEPSETALAVRRDRWLQGRFLDLYQQAGPQDRARLDALLRKRLDAALAETSGAKVRRFADSFRGHPLADEAMEGCLVRPGGTRTDLDDELLRMELDQSASRERRGAAAACLARLLADGRAQESAAIYQVLRDDYRDVVCQGGKTGREVYDALPAGSAVRAAADGVDPWPTGTVEASTQGSAANRGTLTPGLIEVSPSTHPLSRSLSVESVQSGSTQRLILRDDLGDTAFFFDLSQLPNSVSANYPLKAVRHGRLLVVQRGLEILALDTLARDDPVLWRKTLEIDFPGMALRPASGTRIFVMPNGVVRAMDPGMDGLATLDAAESSVVCYQRLRTLSAVEPLTGREVWERHDVAPGSDVYSDGERLFVVARQSTQALVLRASDGKELGYREVPPAQNVLARHGGCLLVRSDGQDAQAGGATVLRVFDVWRQCDLWRRDLPAGAVVATVGDDAFALLDKQGNLAVLDLPRGRPRLQATLPPDEKLADLLVLRSRSRYLVFANRDAEGNLAAVRLLASSSGAAVNGRVYGFDRATRKLVWERDVAGSIDTSQPGGLPVLVIAARTIEQNADGRGVRQFGRLLCIDKRHGATLHDESSSGVISRVQVAADFSARTVTIEHARDRVVLKFTDAPRPSPAAPGGAP